jgi:hypothetical protein
MAVTYLFNTSTLSSSFVVLHAESCITLAYNLATVQTLDTACQSPLDQTPDPQVVTEQARKMDSKYLIRSHDLRSRTQRSLEMICLPYALTTTPRHRRHLFRGQISSKKIEFLLGSEMITSRLHTIRIALIAPCNARRSVKEDCESRSRQEIIAMRSLISSTRYVSSDSVKLCYFKMLRKFPLDRIDMWHIRHFKP